MSRFGVTNPIAVDENDIILAGHGRWQAAKHLALSTISVIVLAGLSEAEKRAYVLADNKLAEMAGYDRPALALELQSLLPQLFEAEIDPDFMGFETAEIDSLLGDIVDPKEDPADEHQIPAACRAVSQLGDR